MTRPLDNITAREVLGELTPIIEVLDAGASALSEQVIYAPLLKDNAATVTGFEPNQAQLDLLRARFSDSSHRWLPYFLGNGEKTNFYITKHADCSSLFAPNLKLINEFNGVGAPGGEGFFEVAEISQVQTTRLDDITDLTPPDYIKADIQGGELDMLRHGTNTLKNALVLQVECEFVEIYQNQPLFGDIQVFLREQGFILHKMIDINGRAFKPLIFGNHPYNPMSQILWADCIFVRDFMKLAELSNEQLLKTFTIMVDIYKSWDLAYRILTEYDARTGAQLGRKFLELMMGKNLPVIFMNVGYVK